MKKDIIFLNKDHSISYTNSKKLNKKLDTNVVEAVVLPLMSNTDISESIVLDAGTLITKFSKCQVKFGFRVEFFVNGDEEPSFFPEITLNPESIFELYDAFHMINVVQYVSHIMTSDTDFDRYCIFDLYKFSVDIKDTNFGNIQLSFGMKDIDKHGERYLFADNLERKLKKIFSVYTSKLSHDERLYINNDKWSRTRAINDDGIYMVKLYPNSIMATTEETYKTFKKIMPHSVDIYADFITYESKISLDPNTIGKRGIAIDDDSVIQNFSFRLYTPEDIFSILSSINYLRNAFKLVSSALTITGIDKIHIMIVITFQLSKWYHLDYGMYPNMEYGNIEIPIYDLEHDFSSIAKDFYREYRRQEKLL